MGVDVGEGFGAAAGVGVGAASGFAQAASAKAVKKTTTKPIMARMKPIVAQGAG